MYLIIGRIFEESEGERIREMELNSEGEGEMRRETGTADESESEMRGML